MKVLLIRPPDPMGMVNILSHVMPTNLGYLASYLLKHNFEVDIWDYETELFDVNGFLNRLKEYDPQIVGFSCMTPTIINGAVMAKLVKGNFPNILTVVGGPHSSALPDETLKEFPYFDLIVCREGEETLLEICQRFNEGDSLNGVEGIVRRDGDGIIYEKHRDFLQIDNMPWPARHLYQNKKEQRGHSSRGFSNEMRSTEIFTSRGCPYKCTFCAIVANFGRTFRYRELDDIFEEIQYCKNKYGINHFVIADDTFGLKKGRTGALCEGFKRLKLESWSCDTRVNVVTREDLRDMAISGCTKVAFGIESGSPKVIALNKKKIDLDRVVQAVEWASESGIKHIEGNFIIGSHPDEDWEDIKLTAKLIRKLPLTFASISVIVPYPGTENYNIMKEKGYLLSRDWTSYVMFGKVPLWRTEYFSPDDLIRIQKKLTRRFYLNFNYIFTMLKCVRSLEELKYYTKSAASLIEWLFNKNISDNYPRDDLRKLVNVSEQNKITSLKSHVSLN